MRLNQSQTTIYMLKIIVHTDTCVYVHTEKKQENVYQNINECFL